MESEEQTALHESSAQYLSFEWLHIRVSFTDLKVRNTIIQLILDFGSERVTCKKF